MRFDCLFGYSFDYEANKEYFRIGKCADPFGEELTPYGRMVIELGNARGDRLSTARKKRLEEVSASFQPYSP